MWDEEKKHWLWLEEPIIETDSYDGCVKEAKEKIELIFPEICQKYPNRRAIPGINFMLTEQDKKENASLITEHFPIRAATLEGVLPTLNILK